MIIYIDTKLNTWARWVATGRKVIGLGYPSQVSFSRLTPASPTLQAPIENEDAWEMEKAIQRLTPQLRETVEQFYLRMGTVESHARDLHICRDTLYSRIHNAHVRIMEWMQVGDEEEVVINRLTRSDTFGTKRVR